MALTPITPKSESEKQAAREAAQQDMLLREVDDAVRQDDATEFVRRYGKPLGALFVAALLAFAGWLWWSGHRAGQEEEGSEAFVKALDQFQAGNLDTADRQLATIAENGAPAAAAAAAMMRAGIAAQNGNIDQAAQMFNAVAADGDAPKEYRDFATVRAVAASYEKMKPEDVVARLKPLATPGNPWFASAAELVAMAYIKQGNNDLAGPLFTAIAQDETAPDTARSRARQMAGMLGFDAIEDVDATLAELRERDAAAQAQAQAAQ
ncbi:tetratricopeptide repeat protein [Tsuneonella sp. HG222]